MTSVASFNGATTAGNYTLVFSGVRIPSSAWLAGTNGWVDRFTSQFQRETPVQRRQNYTSSLVILDGRYPAQVWQHEFLLYTETGSLGQMVDAYSKLEAEVVGEARPLRIHDGDTGTVIFNFGNCYLEDSGLDEPREFLLHKAGFFRITFVGNTRPTVS